MKDWDWNAPLDAPIRLCELEEQRRSEEARKAFEAYCESDEGRAAILDAYERAKTVVKNAST